MREYVQHHTTHKADTTLDRVCVQATTLARPPTSDPCVGDFHAESRRRHRSASEGGRREGREGPFVRGGGLLSASLAPQKRVKFFPPFFSVTGGNERPEITFHPTLRARAHRTAGASCTQNKTQEHQGSRFGEAIMKWRGHRPMKSLKSNTDKTIAFSLPNVVCMRVCSHFLSFVVYDFSRPARGVQARHANPLSC